MNLHFSKKTYLVLSAVVLYLVFIQKKAPPTLYATQPGDPGP